MGLRPKMSVIFPKIGIATVNPSRCAANTQL